MIDIYIENLTEVEINKSTEDAIKSVIKAAVADEYPEHMFEVNLTICDDAYIKEINKQYRGKNTATDVLSFPMLDFDTPDIQVLLGDIIISVEKAIQQADEYGHTLHRELCFLAVHSALHLLGYDHEATEEDRLYMEEKQEYILNIYDIKR
ncbi:rRNA maturation RNase YbeY [Eubacteriales bacterium OttesenSCG-928-G02]|nr:rRNA maturation RNase YbeY [Eubacteriales bacterium OttesenSCG-928-G02]